MIEVFSTAGIDPKICLGMSLSWVKKNIFHGIVNSMADLDSVHQMADMTHAFGVKTGSPLSPHFLGNGQDIVREYFSLLGAHGLSTEDWQFGMEDFEPFLFTCHLSTRDGVNLILVLGSPEIGSHMMATRVQGDDLDFLDPAHGLYRFTSSSEFMHTVARHISQHCSQMKMGWLIIKVATRETELDQKAKAFVDTLSWETGLNRQIKAAIDKFSKLKPT